MPGKLCRSYLPFGRTIAKDQKEDKEEADGSVLRGRDKDSPISEKTTGNNHLIKGKKPGYEPYGLP